MRRTQLIMNDWLFTDLAGNKQTLNLPHTWNALDGQDGGDDYKRGSCTYEKQVKAPEYDKETERVYLQFHGVNASAKVVLNGTEVITHDGGYSTFRVDVTDVLVEENTLLVEVDNSKNTRVYPQMADFTFYGGIYRDVEFLVVPAEHFDLDYCGSKGIKITPAITPEEIQTKAPAKVRVETYIKAQEGAIVQVEIKDAEGHVVAKGDGTDVTLHIENPHLWNGIEDPYLYTVEAALVRDGKVIDTVSSTCGIRSISFDSKQGFFLNGKSYPLHGVSRHQDWKGIGNAINHDNMDLDMELIKEIGANTIRLAHYQHDQYFYDLCDKEGMIVWAEIPYISHHMPDGNANTHDQMEELIAQNYNHPSIVTWGISNEITIKVTDKKDMLDNHKSLQNFVHKMDPTRPTTMACYAMCGPFNRVTKITDIVAWNLYLGWYVPFLWLNDLWIGFYHLIYPNRCLGYSEYGAEGMPNLHSEKAKRGDNTEEYQNIYHEYMLECFKRHPYMWGTYIWNMFDFAADARNQGGEPGMNHKGMVTFDRKTKKDCFYLYKAYWNKKDPFVYIAGKRFVYRKNASQEITVYSNQSEVSLYHNGQLVETKKQTDKPVFKFKVALVDGENKFEVKSGELTDNAVICRTNEPHPEYVVQKVDTKNWM
ncbi:MAG: glycoside hydrolase family 2 protein [Agathobacter sp.]|nr:glycoside hydrolase family 2 protein [Agathobacter sp.]